MPLVRFEPTVSVMERAKTVRALDRAATATGKQKSALKTKSVNGMATYAYTNYGSIWHYLTIAFEMLIDVDGNWCEFCASGRLSTSVPGRVTSQWPAKHYSRTHDKGCWTSGTEKYVCNKSLRNVFVSRKTFYEDICVSWSRLSWSALTAMRSLRSKGH
jgi:hypothetical protein